MREKVSKIWNSLSGRLTSFTLALSIIPLLFLAWLSYVQSSSALLSRIQQDFNQTAISQSQTIDQWIKERQDDMVVVMAGTARVRTMDLAKIADSVKQYFDQWGTYENMAVYTPDGASIYRTDGKQINVSDRDYFQKALLGEVNISDPLVSKASGQVVYVLAAPITNEGQVVGVQTGTISLGSFDRMLQNAYRGQTGEAYLVDRQGMMLTASRFNEALAVAGLIEEKAEMELIVDTEGSRRALAGETGTSEHLDYRGEPAIGAYAPIPSTDWGLLVEQDRTEAFKEILALRNLVILIVVGLAIFIIILAVLLSRSITVPLGIVTDVAKRLAEGDTLRGMDQSLKDKVRLRKDEIGSMGRAFDQLTAYTQEMAHAAQMIAQNDLTVSIQPKSEKDKLGRAFVQMIAQQYPI